MKTRLILPLITALLFTAHTVAQTQTKVTKFNLAGPWRVAAPAGPDTVDVNGKAFDPASLLKEMRHDAPSNTIWQGPALPRLDSVRSAGVLTFYINNADYVGGKLTVSGPTHHRVLIDGEELQGNLSLNPDHHTIAVEFIAEPSDSDSLCVTIEANRAIEATTARQHPYMLHDLTDGRRVRDIRLSPQGEYALLAFQTTQRGGESRWEYELRRTKDGQLVTRPQQAVRWMPRSCAYIEEVWENARRCLYRTDLPSGQRTLLAIGMPKGSYSVSPTEDFAIVTVTDEGPKEADSGVFEVVEMDDRQPGWRDRTHLIYYNFATGLTQRLTLGRKGERLHSISGDGSTLLASTTRSRLERRPTSVTDYHLLHLKTDGTPTLDTLLAATEFIDDAFLSPDASKVLFMGSPEAFGRLGCVLPDSVTPSMTEHELFLLDVTTKEVKPLTRDFDPSVNTVRWTGDGKSVIFSAEDRDYVRLYSLNIATGGISQLPLPGDYAYRFDIAAQASAVACLSYETLAPASAFVMTMAKGKPRTTTLFNGREILDDVQLCSCQDWNYANAEGDTIYGRLYLPPGFDATKKYPMIVYYYGGCSPVSRYFESPYAPQMWASMGYVAYIPQPSGATGFGQRWSARHVNTAGRGPAEDIIEGVRRLCAAHPFIDEKKIGCMGASYGGFMTQYLQTVTDIFACAVSHAGIANHTSYWGEGYWGYNYSEVSMAGSYPWSHRRLFVDQSPLFNADKIHTPLLLLHGTDDTNVPIVESLQMFTALKLLGREVALVEVEGQNHHITDYKKRERWIATQMAWFQRWLKDDASWWEALYPKKNL